MEKRKGYPLPVDPVDGTKVYMPLGKRFSAGEELCGVRFEESGEIPPDYDDIN